MKEDLVEQIQVGELQKKYRLKFLARWAKRFFEFLGRKLYEKGYLSEITEKDVLTGLYNRNFLERWFGVIVSQAERVGANLSLVMIDVNDLKKINDRGGHREGDKLLRRMGRSLARHARLSDLVIRLGGDEFAMVLWNCDQDGAETMMKKQVARLKKKEIGVCYGVALWRKGQSLSGVVAEADEKMYRMKKRK